MKESEVVADIICPEYSASINELKDFKNLIKKLETDFAYAGAVKIIVSKRYKENYLNKIDENSLNENFNLKHVSYKIPEKIVNETGLTYEAITKCEKKMKYKEFKKIITPSPELSVGDSENLTWEMLSKQEELRPYVVDQVHSFFPKQSKVMNLNEFTYAESFLHAEAIEDIEGIQKSNIYIGQFYTIFSFHLEYFNLGAISFLHYGKAKIWYVVPNYELEKLENLMNSFGISSNVICKKLSKHKSLMVPPSVLKQNGIKFTRIIQKPNEFVVIFPGSYHSGLNCGNNIAEGINFGCDSWLEEYPKFTLCDCKKFNKHTLGIKHIFDDLYKKEIDIRKNENIIKCDLCSKTFKEKRYVAKHMKTHQELVNRYCCTNCDKTYTRKMKLILHFKNSHTEEIMPTDFKPKLTENIVNPNKKTIKRHKRTCPICDKVFHSTNSVKQHLLVCPKSKH